MDDTHPYVVAYKDIVCGPLQQFLLLSQKIGGEVQTQADMVSDAFKSQILFMSLVPSSKGPTQNELVELLKPIADKVQAIQAYREKNRPSKFLNHLSAVSESSPALFWVSVTPTPAPYVKEMMDAGQFYSNRVLMEYKDKDKTHVDWVKAWIQTLTELHQYIKQHHTTGVSWNPRGGSALALNAGKPAVSKAPPPPPPGPAPSLPSAAELAALASPAANDGRAALFEQLNRGDEVAKGLRKVTSDQMTHKNPSLRLQNTVPSKPDSSHLVGATKNVATVVKPPKFELLNKKWVIEYHKDNKNLVVSDASMNQSVYIFSCTDSTVVVKGKVNSVTMDACKKCALVFDDIVASVEFINCQRIQAQAMVKVPTVSIDKTDGIQIYLGPSSLDTEIVSSKSSEMNVLIPRSDGEYMGPEMVVGVFAHSLLLSTPDAFDYQICQVPLLQNCQHCKRHGTTLVENSSLTSGCVALSKCVVLPWWNVMVSADWSPGGVHPHFHPAPTQMGTVLGGGWRFHARAQIIEF